MEAICERIKQARIALGYSQDKFSSMAGLTRRGIQQIEAGHQPREVSVSAICKAHKISRAWLQTGLGPMILQATTDEEIIDEYMATCPADHRAMMVAITKTPGGWQTLARIAEKYMEIMEQQKNPDD